MNKTEHIQMIKKHKISIYLKLSKLIIDCEVKSQDKRLFSFKIKNKINSLNKSYLRQATITQNKKYSKTLVLSI